MNEKEFPEQEKLLHPESEAEAAPDAAGASVDFSDLGPLFAPEQDSQEEKIEFEPESSDAPAEKAPLSSPEPEDGTVEFEPAEPETPAAEAGQPEGAVDFSDLGPLFSPAETAAPAVLPGEAALLLKKLSELPSEQPEQEMPEEEPVSGQPGEEASENEQTEAAPPLPEEAEQAELPEETAEAEGLTEASPEEPETASPEAEAAEENASEENASQEEAPEEELSEAPENSGEPLQEAPASEEEEKASEEEPAPRKRAVRKGRPRRKKGEGFFGIPNLLVTLVWIAITVLIGVTLGRMAWVCAADVLAFGKEDKPVTITVYEADTIEDITKKLYDGGLIRYPGLFKLYASLAVDEGEIQPGIWDLNTRYDYHALVNMMSPSSSREVIELMIPEGYSCRQIFALMEENKICTALDLASYAAVGDLGDYWFLEQVPRGDMYCLEGFLFPDTYQFYKNDSPRNVLTKMLDNFENKFDEAMIAQIDTLNAHLEDMMREGGHGDEFIAGNRFDVRDVINVASLIEKETSSAEEGYVIASVIYNRLFNWPDNVPYLNIDATIVYALGGKNKLTPEDLKVNSPYNTYTHTGLTPGPIANPGLASIRAALDPAESHYYYYVLDPALGSHRFSTTYDEHKANIASIGG